MKLNLYKKSFLSVISIFILIISISVFPQQRKDRIETKNVTRQPAVNNPSPVVEQKKPAYNPPPSPPQRPQESQPVQRPVVNNHVQRIEPQRQAVVKPAPQIQRPEVNNPAPRIEQKKQMVDETPQRNYEPKIIERPTETKIKHPSEQKKQVVDESGSKKPLIKQPVRQEERPTPPNVQHDPPEVINQPGVVYTEPVYIPDPPIIYCPEPTIIVSNPIVDPIDERKPFPLPVKKLSLKEQAIQDYYDEYYFDALIDLNAAIAKDSLDLELFFWRGMTWFKLENYDSSVVDLSRYLKLYNDDAEAYYYRALSNYYLINKLEAYHDFLKANELGYQKAEDMLDKYFKDYHVL